MFGLQGCGDGGNDNPERVAVNDELAAPVAEPPEAPRTSGEPMMEPVELELEMEVNDRRQLLISGRSNLPNGAQLRIVVERESSRVRWQSRVNVNDGSFEAGPFGPGSGLPDGNYLIEVQMPPANVQPMTVREVIGEQGEHLSGPLVRVSRHGLGNEVSLRTSIFLGDRPRVR